MIKIHLQVNAYQKEAAIQLRESSPSPPSLHQAQCPHEHLSTTGGYHFVGGDIWDDITEVCDDCGANLSLQTFACNFDE